MGIGKKVLKIAEKLSTNEELYEVMGLAWEKVNTKIEDEQSGVDALRERMSEATDQELLLYIPDVYQKNIYKIDYLKLQAAGIRLISFDIDDTISDSIKNKTLGVEMSADAKNLFQKLKNMGFIVTLLSNAHDKVARAACEQLKADGYIAKANKPETMNFEVMQKQYGVEKSQMAHVGNSMRDDILGGNKFGIITCLVRRNGISMSLAKHVKTDLIGIPTKGQVIREELLKRDLWRRHHLAEKGDQYYQLGEIPAYRK